MSIYHWLIMIGAFALIVAPVAKIMRRMGFSPWLSLLAIIPIASLIFLWVIASVRWPAIDGERPAASE